MCKMTINKPFLKHNLEDKIKAQTFISKNFIKALRWPINQKF